MAFIQQLHNRYHNDGICIVITVFEHYKNVSHHPKRWDPSEPGVAELLKQGVYLPLPGYDDQV